MGRKNHRKKPHGKPNRADWHGRTESGWDERSYVPVHRNTSERKQPLPLPHRGEIWFARLGSGCGTSVQRGTRPVLIISNDKANRKAGIFTVIPMTSRIKKTEMLTHVLLDSGLCEKDPNFDPDRMEDSMLLVEQLTTIGKESLLERMGRVRDPDKLGEIEQAVEVQTGILPPDAAEERREEERW